MNATDFYQPHLDRVSRSFAFCIARLEGELRDWVSLSYLLCRLLDTIEDAAWPNRPDQDRAFDAFRAFLENPPTPIEVSAWAQTFPAGIEPGEQALLGDAYRCFTELHSLPPEVKEKIRRPVLHMYKGMRHFLAERRANGGLRLRTMADVNQYCFFVAGLVGELLTDLVAHRRPGAPHNYRDAFHFGLFLQKINLLKDQAQDEREGRFLVPSRREMLASLAHDAEGAIRYLTSLPLAERGFRLFCGWSLFLGLASLPWIERSSLLGMFTKIPRLVTQALLGKVEKIIDDNQALASLFREMLPKLPPWQAPATVGALPYMEKIYGGALKQEDFHALGLLPARA